MIYRCFFGKYLLNEKLVAGLPLMKDSLKRKEYIEGKLELKKGST
jgi:hypothetical protein